MSTQDDLNRALDNLTAGRPPDPEAGRRVADLARAMAQTDAGAALLKRRAVQERNHVIIELARAHFDALPSVRGQSREVLRVASRYQCGRWRHDRLRATNPYQRGSAEALLWAALKAWPHLPSQRKLQDLLSNTRG